MDDLEAQLADLHSASWAWATSCCGDRDEAEDVLQTVYLKVLDGSARFGGKSAFKTWLFAVIRRTAAGRRRRSVLRRGLLERWLLETERAGGSTRNAEDLALLSERSRRVRRALDGLSRRQRQVVELVFYHDLSLAETAGVLGISLGSVRQHYARGKAELARRLRAQEGA